MKANLDCSDRSILTNVGIVEPRDIVVDLNSHLIYWVDSKSDLIAVS